MWDLNTASILPAPPSWETEKGGFGLLPLMDLGVWGLFYGHAGGGMSMGWAEGTDGPQTGTVMGKCTRTDDIDLHDAV